jgi:hypothetical protein
MMIRIRCFVETCIMMFLRDALWAKKFYDLRHKHLKQRRAEAAAKEQCGLGKKKGEPGIAGSPDSLVKWALN